MSLSLYNSGSDEKKRSEFIETASGVWNILSDRTQISYFLSWGWVKNWLHSLPNNLKIRLAVIYDNDNPVCAFFIGEREILRNKFFKSHSLYLNTTGFSVYDDLCLENNTILCDFSEERRFAFALKYLGFKWDELHLPAMNAELFPVLTKHLNQFDIIIEEEEKSYYVDLGEISKDHDQYLSLLSSNTRSQIRRSYRDYKDIGEISLEVANDQDKAFQIFEELVSLHNKSWQEKGQPGVFKSDYFISFHENLIRDRLPTGEIQLIRITAGDETIACLYNFVFKGVVHYYQSGINYELNSRLKPGLVSHTEAIIYNANLGHRIYDFLGGDSQYKRSLSTGEQSLIWAKVQKPKFRFRVENLSRSLKRLVSAQATRFLTKL